MDTRNINRICLILSHLIKQNEGKPGNVVVMATTTKNIPDLTLDDARGTLKDLEVLQVIYKSVTTLSVEQEKLDKAIEHVKQVLGE